ncbi:MAG: hypothetical protein KME04_03845 [Pleurocapsa minor GSE-CHR-MK-17-07R]|jgi:hypothetical protein|nr:hypothetical protein [Pleurocapsa minor GSE-CHR-MK 17-07R]
MTISRRGFLSSVGAGAASLPFARLPSFGLTAAHAPRFSRGRVLAPVTLADGSLLLPDTIIPLHGEPYGRSMATAYGSLPAETIQPLHDIDQLTIDVLPAPVRVVTPVAPVLSYCDDHASLAGLPGYGTPLLALSSLNVGGADWLELADSDGQSLGWSRASHWTGWVMNQQATISRIVIHRSTLTLSVGQRAALTEFCPVSLSHLPEVGRYPLMRMAYAEAQSAFAPHVVVPFVMQADGLNLAGAYWHNAFGRPEIPVAGGADVHVPMWAAQWLYENTHLDAIIEVVQADSALPLPVDERFPS